MLRKGSLEALRGRSDFAGDVLTIRNHGAEIPIRLTEAGHYFLSVPLLGEGPPRLVRGPKFMASYFERASAFTRPDMTYGGLNFLLAEDELYRFGPPRTFSARKAVPVRDARDGWLSDPKQIPMKSFVNWGRASAQRQKRVEHCG